MKKLIILFHILPIIFLSSCSNDDYIEPYYFNINVDNSSIFNNDWSDNSEKTIVINIEETASNNSTILITKFTDEPYMNDYIGDLEFNVIGNQIEIKIDPLSETSYYSFVIEISKSNVKRYIAITSNINSENKEFFHIWKSVPLNLMQPTTGQIPENYERDIFISELFSNISGDILNSEGIVKSSIINNSGILEKYRGFMVTTAVLRVHSEIN